MEENKISTKHPRAESLRIRHKLTEQFKNGIVAEAGLIAHGRGEAFDYLLGEKTPLPAQLALKAAAATLLTAKQPVISVNGNAAALAANELVQLAKLVKAKIEVNLFYRSLERELAIQTLLQEAGAEVLGVGTDATIKLSEIQSERQRVDARGILIADVIFVPLEDGDRTEALVKRRKTVIAVDLNPLSRTSRFATITIIDNIVRALPALIENVEKLKKKNSKELERIKARFDNQKNIRQTLKLINRRLVRLSKDNPHKTDPRKT